MRKSTTMTLMIMLIAFGGMLLAADVFVLGPAKKDLAIARELEGALGPDGRDWIIVSRETAIRLRTMPGSGPDRLAQDESTGIAVQVHPKRGVLEASRRAQALASYIMDTVLEGTEGETPIHWVEIMFRVGEHTVLKTLIRRNPEGGGWIPPEPPIPEQWDESEIPEVLPGPK